MFKPSPAIVHLFLTSLAFLVSVSSAVQAQSPDTALFRQDNLAAWCIVPFDAAKRGPEERAAMLEKLALGKFVYDYRAEHIPQWDDELTALKKHHIELFGWWFPTSLNDEAKKTLDLFKRHNVHPQLWVNGNGGPIEVTSPEDQQDRIAKEVARLKPICEAAAPLGCQVALYNHGSWYGEPENAIAIIEALKAHGLTNIGMVYNLHHGHGHLARLEKVLPKMLPHLLCFNLNGMDVDGEASDRKILPLGAGTEDVKVLKTLATSGYKGVIGILNHTPEDAEGRLQDNLDGLRWLLPQVEGKPAPGPKPEYRTWKNKPKSVAAPSPPAAAQPVIIETKFVEIGKGQGAPSINDEFGQALRGGMVVKGKDAYRTLPLSIECRAKLNSSSGFNILAANDPKNSATHWEIYSYRKTGFFSLFLPGRGGEYQTKVNICDGKWHDLIAAIEEDKVTLFVDGKIELERATTPLQGKSNPGDLAFLRLVEGGVECDGIIDDVRISRGPMKPRKGDQPRQRMDITLDLWNFDNLDDFAWLTGGKSVPEPTPFTPDRKPLRESEYPHWQAEVNRERVFDYYAKQAVLYMSQTPPELIAAFPGLDGGQQGHWGNQNDAVTWRDARWSEADRGSIFSGVFKGAGQTIPKAVCVRDGDLSACFNPVTCTFPLTWTGGFLKLSDARHGFMGGGVMEGKVVNEMPPGSLDGPRTYHGFYRHGGHIIFSYSVKGMEKLETAKDGLLSKEVGTSLTKGGPAQWPGWIETKGVIGTGEPFATDTLTIPFDNPYGTLFFISGHDFFSDGTAAVATMTGEVWLVKGIDDKLEKLRWKRFATGLHHPLGVKVIKDKLHVLGRDQITCLHDLNGDDEADFYECVTNAQESSPGGHDFITGLDADSKGDFYFASGNQGVCKVTPPNDLRVLATGFRNPNGIGLSPDARFITTSVQEGDWTPASSICQIDISKNVGAHFGAGGPKKGLPVEPPLMYFPRGEDNSSGGQCFIPEGVWPALSGQGNFAHFSPGTGTAWLVMRQQVHDRWQGAAVRISGSFDSGAQAGRFHPVDHHLYVTGMQGWGSYTPKDGCFQRVRYTGAQTPVPVGFEARDNGFLFRFDRVLDKDFVASTTRHFAQCWNYHYSAAYGSPEFSTKYPDTVGHDPLEIRSGHVLGNGKTLFLEIPQLTPASMIHLHVGVTADRSHDVFLTAHNLDVPFTEFPGYQKIAKTQPIAPAPSAAVVASKPNPWAKGDAGRAITVDAALGLQYVQKQLTAKAGERISLTFTNPDVVPHNWMLGKPGTLKPLGDKANLMITDPKGLAKHYVPDSDDVLVFTDMVNPKESFTIHFQAPKEKGDYPYLCTFPGHWMVMNGTLKVE